MTANHTPVAVATGMSPLTAAKFGPGMLLQDDDLAQLGTYTQELSRLIFRSLFGCGVVCGLVVGVDQPCGKLVITVADGLALDGFGDPVHVPRPVPVTVDSSCDPNFPTRLWVVLCSKRKCCAPRPAMCASDDEESPAVCTRERYGFEIRVARTRPACVCGCPESDTETLLESDCRCANPALKCYKHHYKGDCKCTCSDTGECDCDCILLARLESDGDPTHPTWTADHSVRRFIRPVLIEDPQVRLELDRKRLQYLPSEEGGAGTPPPPVGGAAAA
jgi:hypothetical protein